MSEDHAQQLSQCVLGQHAVVAELFRLDRVVRMFKWDDMT